MDARHLRFPDGVFDFVFSLSSIEHFGGPADIEQAAADIGRVVRPEGHACVVTEYVRATPPTRLAADPDRMRAVTLGRRCGNRDPAAARGGRLHPARAPQPDRRPVRPATMQELDLRYRRRPLTVALRGAGGSIERRTPHILLRAHGAPWTSICLVLEKPSS